LINLIQGDCLERMKEIGSGSVDMVLTDPPYGTTACKWDSIIPPEPMWEQLKRIIKPNGAIVLTGSEPFSSFLRVSNIKQYKYDWIWNKVLHSNPLIAKKQPLSAHETISVFYKKQPTYNPQMEDGDKSLIRNGEKTHLASTKGHVPHTISKNKTGKRYPKKIITIPNSKRGGLHPTQKPVALMEYLIKTYTNEGETVLDFTMGSGTTGVAAKNLGRDFIGIELDETYFDIAQERINNA
jgi:site-specific DNA-methyltransferase (adenine-specific)